MPRERRNRSGLSAVSGQQPVFARRAGWRVELDAKTREPAVSPLLGWPLWPGVGRNGGVSVS